MTAYVAAVAVVPEHRDIPVLWRVNPEEFNRRFRHQTCVSLVTAKLGADAGTVLAAMLAHSRKFEASLQVSGHGWPCHQCMICRRKK